MRLTKGGTLKFDKIQSMLFDRLQESSKVMHMDAGNLSVRQKLQQQLAMEHRTQNPDSGYYDYPSVQDHFGDSEAGSVVHSKGGQHTMSDYKKSGTGFTLSNHRTVKPAYVVVKNDAEEQKESIVYVDGKTLMAGFEESGTEATVEESVDLREACFDAQGNGTVKLIAPGHGATGYYSPEVLKEATKKGVFDNAQMFLDHATEEEEAARPEGSVKGLAAKGGKAVYNEAGADGPGVYTQAKAYNDMAPFINERSKDIGISIRAAGRAVVGQVGGKVNKIVKSIDILKSADFVTRAGAGGKPISLMESFRASHPQSNTQEKEMAKVEIDDTVLASMKESVALVPQLKLQLDRNNERFNKLDARDFAVTYLKESALPAPAQARLLKMVTSNQYSLPIKDGVLDQTAFTESLKTLVTEEAAYLKESGSGLRLVAGMGDAPEKPTDEDTKFAESQKKLDGEFENITRGLSGVPAKKKEGVA